MVSGVTVTLDNGLSTTTDSNGNYSFTGLASGNYNVTISNRPSIYTPSVVNEGTGATETLLTNVLVVLPRDGHSANDFGLSGIPSSIAGTVYEDSNGDDSFNGSDFNRSGIVVTLKDGSGNVVATTTTDSSGNYSFTGLDAMSYTISIVTPQGYPVEEDVTVNL